MKVFNRKQSNFDLGTSMGTGPKLIFFSSGKILQSSGVPIKLLTKKIFVLYRCKNLEVSLGNVLVIFNDSLKS